MRSVKQSYVVLWTTLSVFLLLTLSSGPVMAAQDAVVCPADRLNSNGNICTASDVQLAAAGVGNVDAGLTCMAGEDVEVAIAGTVNLRKGDRFDIGVWISSDGKPIDVRGGNDLLDPGNVPDLGGAQTCEVMPLPSLGIAADLTVTPNIIDSFDDAATPQDCYDTKAANNGDEASNVQLTTDRDSIINGMVDVNGDGVIDGTDNSGPGNINRITGFHVFAGLLDLDDDGIGGEVNGDDDGVWSGYAVVNGIIDVDGDGIYGAVDGTDDSAQSFNDSVTMKCVAGSTGKLALESLVSWHVPSDAADVCNATNPDSYGPFGSSKCSVNSSEIDVEIVGRVTVIKSAPAATNNEEFEFSYANSAPTFADTSDLIPDLSEESPFNLMDTEEGVIYAVIGTRDGIDGPFIPASVVITETNLPNGWQLEDISCVLADEGIPVNTTVDVGTATAIVELSYNDADPEASQDDVVCTFVNAPEPATITVIKNSSGGDDTFNFDWGSTNNTPSQFQLTTSGGTATTNPVITVTAGLGDSDFAVIEDLSQNLVDWEFTSANCVDEADQPIGTPVNIPPLYSISGMTLNAGDDITCTFINAKKGTVNIVKQTVGGNGTFGYSTTLPGTPTFTLMTTSNTSPAESRSVSAGSYTVTEDVIPAGFQFTTLECTEIGGVEDSTTLGPVATLNVQDGETINCVYTNTADGVIITDKVTNPSGEPDLFTFTPSWGDDFQLADGDTPNQSGFLTPGTYSVSESPLVGWDLTDTTCTGNTDEDPTAIDLEPGEVVTCVFTNTKRGVITVVKSITIDSGTGPADENFSFTGTGPDGYDFEGGFILSTDVVDAEFQSFIDLVPGDYAVTESSPVASGWALVGTTCTGENFPDPITNPATIALAPGEEVTCTFTNAPLGSTTIVKNSQGLDGIGDVADFDFDFTWGNGTNPNVPEGEASTFTLNTIGDGTESKEYNYKLIPLDPYDLVETGLPDPVGDYAQTWQLSSVGCSDPTPDNTVPDTAVPGANGSDATVVTEANETVTCTFTNVLDGTLVVRKQTTNPDNFDQDFNFVGGVTGTTGDVAGTITDFDIAAEELSHTAQPGWFGSAEEDIAGWEITDISCLGQTDNAQVEIGTAGNFTQPEYNPGDDRVRVDVGAGETIICTFTNQPFGSLTIVKNVEGADATFNFTGLDTVNDPAIVTDFNIDTTGDPDEQVFSGLAPGVYGASELSPVPMGYDLTNIVCDAEDSEVLIGVDGDFDPGDSGFTVDLTNGEDVTCTFTNTQRGTITLVKNLPNDNGGTAQETDFDAFIDDNPVPWGIPQEYVPGNYTASESTLPGYLASGWFNACAADGSVVLGPGENLVCEVTNDDIAPLLTLIKNLPNDNGGTAVPADFQAYINGNPVPWGAPQVLDAGGHTASEDTLAGYVASPWFNACAGDGTVTLAPGDNLTCEITNDDVAPTLTLVKNLPNDNGGTAVPADFQAYIDGNPVPWDAAQVLDAGGYTASEDTVPGYVPSPWFNACAGDGTVTLAPGENLTCEITNDDVASSLTLVKNLPNDNGGTAVPADFQAYIDGNPVSWGAPVELDSGTYVASEDTLPGYTPSAWFNACAGDGTVTLGQGENLTCEITNDDVAPTLTLVKNLPNDNGGTAVPADFQAYINGNPVPWGDAQTLDAGDHTASEDTLAGYAASLWSNACADDGSVTLAPGENLTCEITNDDIAPLLTLIKDPTNDDFGTALPDDFEPTVGGVVVVSGETNEYEANLAYAIDETLLDGYSFVSIGDDDKCPAALGETITLDVGDDITCTITNDDDPPMINLVKTAAGPTREDGTGDYALGTYTVVYTVTATNGGTGPGEYDLVDTLDPAVGLVLNTVELTSYNAGTEDSQTGTVSGAMPYEFANGDLIVEGEELAAGLNESWTITANFTVNVEELEEPAFTCDPTDPQPGEGFYNTVNGNIEEDESDNDACVKLPKINLVKTAVGPTLEDGSGDYAAGTYTVVYTVEATNSGDTPATYDLVDTLDPASGLSLNAVELTNYTPGTENSQTGTLAGAMPFEFASGDTILTNEGLAAGLDESWTITANFTVIPAELDDGAYICNPDDPQAGEGFYNAVAGNIIEDESDNMACVKLPDPKINLAKTSEPATFVSGSTWEVVYTITATNTGEGPGVYDIIDSMMPGDGITPEIDASYPALVYVGGETQTGELTAPPLANGGTWVSLEGLAAMASETWTVTARFTVDEAYLSSNPAAADCEIEGNEQGTGYFNYVEGSETDEDFSDNETCVPHLLPSTPVPTLGTWAMLLMFLLMTGVAGWYIRPTQMRRFS